MTHRYLPDHETAPAYSSIQEFRDTLKEMLKLTKPWKDTLDADLPFEASAVVKRCHDLVRGQQHNDRVPFEEQLRRS